MTNKVTAIFGARKRLPLLLTMGLGSLFVLALPFFSGPYYAHIFILVFLNVSLASGYRLLFATGLGSFCHITFFAVGAYTSALLATKLGLPFVVCFLAAGILPAIVAALVGWPSVRAKGAYFFVITFAFWVVMDSVFGHWTSLTRGTQGISGIPPIAGLTSVNPYYYIILAFSVVTVFILYRLGKSRFGAELLAIGDADDLAEIIGINVTAHRVLAFAIGAMFAGFAGSLYAHYIRFIAPSSFGLFFTVYVFVWTVVGGERRTWGPIVGAIVLTLIAELLRMSGTAQAILYAVVLLIVVMTMPHGMVGLVDNLRARLERFRNRDKRPKIETGLT
jgi:branched-chain amino acid transport system permease protein